MTDYSITLPSYSIGEQVYKQIPTVCAPFGATAVVIGGHKAMAAVRERLLAAVKDSAVTVFFSRLGVENVTWYASIHLVMPFISILFIWQMVGFYTVYYLAGIQTIPAQVYEAAVIDGAGKWKTFRYITLPLLKPTTYLVVVYAIIQAFKVYDQIAAICGGAGGGLGSPAGASSTLLTYFYMNSFNYYKVGYGCAVAIVLLLIIVAVNLIQNRITDSGDQD